MSNPDTTERPWPANTPENRRDTGCYVVCKDPDDDEAGQCWCGAEIVGGFGQCAQCRYWLDGDNT